MTDMKLLRIISGVSRRDQWDNRMSNVKRESHNFYSVEKKISPEITDMIRMNGIASQTTILFEGKE